MQYPGAGLPFGGTVGSFSPTSLEQRKRDLMKKLVSGGTSTLGFGGSRGDAPASHPGLSFNPSFSAYLGALSKLNNPGMQASPFFGPGGSPSAVHGAVPAAVTAAAFTGGQAAGAAPSPNNPNTSMVNTDPAQHWLFGGGATPSPTNPNANWVNWVNTAPPQRSLFGGGSIAGYGGGSSAFNPDIRSMWQALQSHISGLAKAL